MGKLDFAIRQQEMVKARAAGLSEPARKFWFAIFKRKGDADAMDVEPELFFPISTIKNVSMSQRREDELKLT